MEKTYQGNETYDSDDQQTEIIYRVMKNKIKQVEFYSAVN